MDDHNTTHQPTSLKLINTESVIELNGYVRKDGYGRLYVDTCATDLEHIIKKPEPGKERLTCRKYIEDIFQSLPEDKKIQIKLSITASIIE